MRIKAPGKYRARNFCIFDVEEYNDFYVKVIINRESARHSFVLVSKSTGLFSEHQESSLDLVERIK